MKTRLSDLITDVLSNHLRNKFVRVGRDRTYRRVAEIEKKGNRWKVSYADGQVRYVTDAALVEIKEEGGGLPPRR